MGSISLTHWIVVALVILVLFGRGKISETMGDFGKGIRSFRKGLSENEGAGEPTSSPTVSLIAQAQTSTGNEISQVGSGEEAQDKLQP